MLLRYGSFGTDSVPDFTSRTFSGIDSNDTVSTRFNLKTLARRHSRGRGRQVVFKFLKVLYEVTPPLAFKPIRDITKKYIEFDDLFLC